jgi:hypothetical protein
LIGVQAEHAAWIVDAVNGVLAPGARRPHDG